MKGQILRSILLASLSFLLLLGTAHSAQAATKVKTTPALGHPSTTVAVSGSGFGASEAVDVYVDTVDSLLVTSSKGGVISGSLTIPASAQPGLHYINAIGRRTEVSAEATFSVTTPWLQFGFGSAHLGTNPWENTLSPNNIASAATLWTNADVYPASGATPAVSGGIVYETLMTGLEASTTSGKPLWNFLTQYYYYASPTVSAGVVYLGGPDPDYYPTMYARNATTGAAIWSTRLVGVEYSPVLSSANVVNGIVYVAVGDGTVNALSAATGAIQWTYKTGDYIDDSLTVVNGVVYFGSEDHNVYALDASSGNLIWKYPTNSKVESTPAVVNNIVYVGSEDGKVYAIEAVGANPGSLLWSYATQGPVDASPAVLNGTVYIGSADDNLYALNAHSGSLQWSSTTGGSITQPAAVANGVVYVSSNDQFLYAVAASNGAILAAALTGQTFLGGPAISDGVLYVSSYGGNLSAISLSPNANAARRQAAPRPGSLHPDMRLRMTP